MASTLFSTGRSPHSIQTCELSDYVCCTTLSSFIVTLELQARIIEELIPLLSHHQLKTLRTTTHIRFVEEASKPRSLIINDIYVLHVLCEDIVNFEQIICRHSHSQRTRTSFFRNPQKHIIFGNITTLTFPMPRLNDFETRGWCQDAFQYMQVEDLTLLVDLDDVSFPSIFSSWGASFLCCVRSLQFNFLGDHLDMEEVSKIVLI